MSRTNDLPDYLSALPDERRALHARLSAMVGDVKPPESIEAFVFLPNQAQHPQFDDADTVFWTAVEQIYLENAATDGELPLLYWGFHSIDILTRRSSNGILITDRSVYVEDVGRTSARMPLAAIAPDAIRVVADTLVVGEAGIGLAQVSRLLGESGGADSVAFLRRVIDIVRASAAASAPQPTSETVDELVRAGRLSADFLLPSRPKDAKRIAKLSAKWQIPADETVLASLSSATFAGIYGLAITDRAIYSRDLMEPLDRTALGDVERIEWIAESSAFRVADGHLVPAFPAVTDDNRQYFIGLLAALIASGR